MLPNQLFERAIARLAGVVLLMFGAGVAAVAVWIVVRQWAMYASVKAEASALVAGFAILAAFTSTIGYRLALNRPNRYGSILSPTAWAGLAMFFVVLGIATVIGGLAQKPLDVLITVPISALLVFGCILARRHAMRRSGDKD